MFLFHHHGIEPTNGVTFTALYAELLVDDMQTFSFAINGICGAFFCTNRAAGAIGRMNDIMQ